MSYNIKDLQKLVQSKEFSDYRKENKKNHILWEKVYARRKELWLTQAELWEKSKIVQNKISQIESWTYGENIWDDILERLSNALNISIDYLKTTDIERKTFEMYNYVLLKLSKSPDPWQFIKIAYFIDLESVKNFWKLLTNYIYVRYSYGPFDKKMYDYQKIFSMENEKWFQDVKSLYLSRDEMKIIDSVFEKYPVENWRELMNLSYQTPPLQKLWVICGDGKHMYEELDMFA